MRSVFVLLFCLTFNFIHSYNYNDPLGLDPEVKIPDDDIVTGDEVVSIPNNYFETKMSEIDVLKKHRSDSLSSEVQRPGYLDSNLVYSGRDLGSHIRFMQKSLTGQDDDYFNKEISNNDPYTPSKDVEMLRKEGLSNGILIYDGKRICNWETGKYPEYYMELSKE